MTNDFRIARMQRTLRWFEEDVPLLNLRVKELSRERQESARKFAAAVIAQTRAELERLLQNELLQNQLLQSEAKPHAAADNLGDPPCEPAD